MVTQKNVTDFVLFKRENPYCCENASLKQNKFDENINDNFLETDIPDFCL